MLYPIVRPMANLALRTFFRKIHISHAERIPRDKPVILAANHPTAFIEPCVLACFLDRPLYFLVRGDLFKKTIYEKMLRALHMLPVYRMKDRGYAYLKRNYETFNYCYEALNENKTVMILAEGRTIHEKRLRPLQKGTARIAFGTLEQYPEQEIYIVPVGVNYTYADRPGSEVMIDFGEPILASRYWARYQENANEAIAEFTDDLRRELEKRVIIIDRVFDEELTEQLFLLSRSERLLPFFPDITGKDQPFRTEKGIADRVNEMEETARLSLLKKTRPYFDALEKFKLTDADLKRAETGMERPGWIFFLGWLPYQLIRLFFRPPMALAKYIADSRVKTIEFYSSVWIASNIGTILIYYLLWFLLSALSGWWLLFLLALLFLPLGYASFWYHDHRKQWRGQQRVKKLTEEKRADLLDQRREIIAQMEELKIENGRIEN
jgi:1-acyl-sn-glycerol-3-phosphate acyltransferase